MTSPAARVGEIRQQSRLAREQARLLREQVRQLIDDSEQRCLESRIALARASQRTGQRIS